jgi:hypothetical protein
MKPNRMSSLFVAILLACVSSVLAQAPSQEAAADLSGPTWQLVKFQGSDDNTRTPDDKSKYTIQDQVSLSSARLHLRGQCVRLDRSTIKLPSMGKDCIRIGNMKALFYFPLSNSTNAGNVLSRRLRRAERCCPMALAWVSILSVTTSGLR